MSTPENPTSPDQPAAERAETGVWERLERAAAGGAAESPVTPEPATAADTPRATQPAPGATTPVAADTEAPRVVAPFADTFAAPHAAQPSSALPGFAPSTQPAAGAQPVYAAREPRPVRTVGVFTLREILFVILSALLVLISFVPAFHLGQFGAPLTLWNLQFAPMPVAVSILPLIALALVLLRRLVPRVNWRVGSLSVDQFASVTTVIAAVSYVLFVSAYTVLTVPGQINWSLPVGTIFALATLFTSTFAPFLPAFKTEFAEREETPAAPVARAPRVITPTPRPRAAQPVPGAAAFGAPGAVPAQPVRTAPFWVYSYTPRPVHSVDGQSVLFEMGPAAWVLAVEDRGTALVLRADDGRIGILHDLSNLTRG
ncbi:hypothetical protein [Mycetocola saprophilus]|uniref:hypothetical protein n=1 Tax=Mycetocola saprophilus TaxID=76636 RepID=UPI0004BE92E6|nr:hypothetical protein [Mycetocola saprophilus]